MLSTAKHLVIDGLRFFTALRFVQNDKSAFIPSQATGDKTFGKNLGE
jgi:hypothetical protein